ncbi:hypothetical protein [Bradyrhizobium sp. CCGE-LA001]|uniref:hypothetical protein n=1 Tax=Bradyrhizobium sp. CCGE-LA001 TaxID=1223566 RepID=UPI0011982840|nr:hypothetical protein [Bradyrhizobium sp. CCGE-LA001]
MSSSLLLFDKDPFSNPHAMPAATSKPWKATSFRYEYIVVNATSNKKRLHIILHAGTPAERMRKALLDQLVVRSASHAASQSGERACGFSRLSFIDQLVMRKQRRVGRKLPYAPC